MSDNEGSVFNEDFDEEVEESEDTTTSEDEENTTQPEGETSDTGEESSESTLKDQEKTELTEKGTKLDENPLSRVNQELANERAKIRQYEEVLNNPTLLKGYVAQFDKKEEQPKEDVSETEMRYEDVKTTEDLQKFLKQQDTKVQQKIKELDSTISHVKSSQKESSVASRIQSDIATVRETYPELNPKSDSYNKELDNAVGELYEKYDLDAKTGSFKGEASIKDIADIVMKAAGSSKKQGSTEAQTMVRDKRTGRAVSGASNTAPDESNMSPAQVIASRIKAARGGR